MLSPVAVVVDETFVGLEGAMHGIVRHVQVEWLSLFHRFLDFFLGFQGQRVAEECVCPVVSLEVGYRPFPLSLYPSVAVLSVVASRMADGGAADVHVEAQAFGVFPFAAVASEVGFSDVDGLVACLFQYGGINHVFAAQSLPVPVERAERSAVVAFGVNPVSGPVTGGVLPGHQRGARGRAYALGVEGAEADALLCQPFHVGRAVPVVQRLAQRVALRVHIEGEGGIHQSHVIHQEKDDVGAVLGGHARSCQTGQSQCAAEFFYGTFHS